MYKRKLSIKLSDQILKFIMCVYFVQPNIKWKLTSSVLFTFQVDKSLVKATGSRPNAVNIDVNHISQLKHIHIQEQ